MPESTQHKLDRVRPPRVQITYDVEIGDAIVMKELPFIVGIMADLSGQPAEALPPLKERKYVEIDRDNLNEIMKAVGPRLALRVKNTLSNGDSSGNENLNVELRFNSLDDFTPLNVLKQVEPMRKLFEARTRLADLLTKLDGNDALDKLLQDVVKNTDGLKEIQASVGGGESNGG
jgi:type VI secretion system protein ImpB